MSESHSILTGVFQLVDDWLELDFPAKTKPLYQHRTADKLLSERLHILSADAVIRAAYERINHNWHQAVKEDRYSKSTANWRFEPHPQISAVNTSPEVNLERAIIQGSDGRWTNQVPTSSGLTGPTSDRTRNIDLIQQVGKAHYSLIELKADSNTPLYAAIEILLYGLLLSWSKNNYSKLTYDLSNQPILTATSIDLRVLAPSPYYERSNLGHLETALCAGLESAQDILKLPCSFEFTQFPHDFPRDDSPEELFASASSRVPVWTIEE